MFNLQAEEIRKVVDSELGFAVDLPYRKNESKVDVYNRTGVIMTITNILVSRLQINM